MFDWKKGLMATLLLVVLHLTNGQAADRDFVVSFGNGGMQSYTVVQNICLVEAVQMPIKFTVWSPANEMKAHADRTMATVLANATEHIRKQFGAKNDGFINMHITQQMTGDSCVSLYHICGDLVQRQKAPNHTPKK
jgi:hypothetical protein